MGVTRIDNIGLAVRDIEAEATFFEEKLGLKVDRSPDAEPPSAVVHVADQYLYVFQTGSDSSDERRSPDLVGNPRGFDHVSFTVEDVDASYRELSERGVEFHGEPTTVDSWGMRMVPFDDAEGNTLFLVQSLEIQ